MKRNHFAGIIVCFVALAGVITWYNNYRAPLTTDMNKLMEYAHYLNDDNFNKAIQNAYADGKLTNGECEKLNQMGRDLKDKHDKATIEKRLKELAK